MNNITNIVSPSQVIADHFSTPKATADVSVKYEVIVEKAAKEGKIIIMPDQLSNYIADVDAEIKKAQDDDKDALVKAKQDTLNKLEKYNVTHNGVKGVVFLADIGEQNDDINKSEQNDIEKGIVESLGYSDEFKLSKKGSEIKQGLKKSCDEICARKKHYYDKALEYKKLAGDKEPTEMPNSYSVDGLIDRMTTRPLLYSYEDIYSDSSSPKGITSVVESQPEENQMYKARRQYNDCIRDYYHCYTEEIKCQTLINNLDDNKSYKLNIEQAAVLGF